MAAEVGAEQSANGIRAVADSDWLDRVRREIGSEPVLDADGAVVISVTAGSGSILEGAPPDRTIKLPALGSHQARVVVTVGGSTLHRVGETRLLGRFTGPCGTTGPRCRPGSP
jgi:hypothetical protein